MHKRITFQISPIWCLPKHPFQQANKSMTHLGIIYCTPNKTNVRDHNSLAISKFKGKWSTGSPLFLHLQHHSMTVMFLPRKLSILRIFPKTVVHVKEATLAGTLILTDAFPRERLLNSSIWYRRIFPRITSSLLASSKSCLQHPF